MAMLECARLMLYLIEWIWTTVILAIFPSRLATRETLTNGEMADACLFNLHLGRSRCDFGIAWAAISFIVLTVTIFWYLLEYCTTIQLPTNVETIIFSWLTLWWGVGAIALTATKAPQAPSPAVVPVVFSWMLVVLCSISAFIASRSPKQLDYRVSETDNTRSRSY